MMFSSVYIGRSSLMLFLVGIMATAPVRAQESRDRARAKPRADQTGQAVSPRQAEPMPPPLPPQLYRDFVFPDPDRPWGKGRYLDPYRRGGPRLGSRRTHQGAYDRWARPHGDRSFYHDEFTYRFGVPLRNDPYSDDLERAYRQGVADGQSYERFEIQAERGLEAYQHAMWEGFAAFEAGDYGSAARQFLLAATLNQGDPASRISAAHAEIALGRYEPAALLLRRAFSLQPKIVYLPMDIRTAYGDPADFTKHFRALAAAANQQTNRADLWFLVGYCLYFTQHGSESAEPFAKAAHLSPDDALFTRLARLAAMATPAPRTPPAGRKRQP